MHRLFALVAVICLLGMSSAHAAGVRTVDASPLVVGPFPVACSDVAYDVNRMNQIGGSPADFWQGNPQNGQLRYFTDILLEPLATIQVHPIVPNDSGFYPKTSNSHVPFVVIVCYPTSASNTRPDYPLPDLLVVPKMQRAGEKPIFPSGLAVQGDPKLLPLLVVSHGLGGSPLGANYLDILIRLASFGYIVAAPFHGDARFSVVQIDSIGNLFSVLQHFDEFVEMEALRPLSLKATVDAVLAHPDFGPRINPDQIGGFGASMGGAALTWLLGASVTDGFVSHNTHPSERDLRLKAAVGYVPYAGESFLPAFGDNNATASNVTTPYLAISGTADNVAPMDRMEQAMNLFQNSHYMVALTGVSHSYDSSYAGDVFAWTIPFLDAYVKGDVSAQANFLLQKDILGGLDDNLVIDYTAPMLGSVVPMTGMWWNPNESGWGMSLSQQGPIIFAAWFRYDRSGNPSWLVMSSCQIVGNTCSGDIYQLAGGTPITEVWDGSNKQVSKVGIGKLSFTDSNTGMFTYTVNGVYGTKSISRQMFASGTTAPAEDHSSLWWNANESGWGVSLMQQDGIIFAVLFSYDSGGNPVWYVASNCTLTGSSCNGTLYQTSGGTAPDMPWLGPVTTTPVGTISFAFTDASNGTMSFTVDGRRGSKAIAKQIFYTAPN